MHGCNQFNDHMGVLFLMSDMREPKMAAKIAKQVKRFHQVEVPGRKEPQLWNDISKFFEKGSLYFLPCN